MWNRKELKTKAKQVVKKNYWTAIVVCFIIALLTGEFGTSLIIRQTDDQEKLEYVTQNDNKIFKDIQIGGINIRKELDNVEILNETQQKVMETTEATLDVATKSQKYILKIWDSINLFSQKLTIEGIAILILALIAIMYAIIIANPLAVGIRMYFLKARNGSETKIGSILEVFKRGSWKNVVKVMFLKDLYNVLWYLTIIGGFIKTYEYRMIPYILAENPNIETKEAFARTKQMMKGNKWKTFVLDLSFFLWGLASVMTFGLVNIFYTNPYRMATVAELYITLKNDEIEPNMDIMEN